MPRRIDAARLRVAELVLGRPLAVAKIEPPQLVMEPCPLAVDAGRKGFAEAQLIVAARALALEQAGRESAAVEALVEVLDELGRFYDREYPLPGDAGQGESEPASSA